MVSDMSAEKRRSSPHAQFYDGDTGTYVWRIPNKVSEKEGLYGKIEIGKSVLSKAYLSIVGPLINTNHQAFNLEFKVVLAAPKPRLVDNKKNETYRTSQGVAQNNPAPIADDLLVFDDLKRSLLIEVRVLLKKSRFFSINELFKQIETREAFEAELESMKELSKQLPHISMITKEVFLSLSTGNKYQSKAVQTLLERGSVQQKQHILRLCGAAWEDLLDDKFGNYILQQAILDSPAFRAMLEPRMISRFSTLIVKEYSSRVMQTMVRVSDSFRHSALNWFASSDLLRMLADLPTVFLLTATMQAVQSPSELAPLKNVLISKTNQSILDNKNYKRVMMSYIEKCPEEELDLVFSYLKLASSFWQLLDEKFGSLVVCSLVSRAHEPTLQILLHFLQNDLCMLLKAKYFKIFIFRLAKEVSPFPIRCRMLRSLFSGNEDNLYNLTRKPETCYYLVFVLIHVLPSSQLDLLIKLGMNLQNHQLLSQLILSFKSINFS